MPVTVTLPVVGGDIGSWGTKLDTALTALEAEINAHEAAVDPHGANAYADTNKLAKGSNLSDLTNAASARANLGLGSAALNSASDFATPASVTAAINAALVANLLVNQ